MKSYLNLIHTQWSKQRNWDNQNKRYKKETLDDMCKDIKKQNKRTKMKMKIKKGKHKTKR